MAKYPYIVNKDGVWYPAGTEVPEGADFVLDGKVVGKVKNDVIEITDKDVIDETLKDMPTYTKTDINRMSTQDLRTLAVAQGFEDVEEYTGGELKKMLIDKLGL